jgi:hypothetical protein
MARRADEARRGPYGCGVVGCGAVGCGRLGGGSEGMHWYGKQTHSHGRVSGFDRGVRRDVAVSSCQPRTVVPGWCMGVGLVESQL